MQIAQKSNNYARKGNNAQIAEFEQEYIAAISGHGDPETRSMSINSRA